MLIFVSIAERYAEIVADAGIDQKAPLGTWAEAVEKLLHGLQRGQIGDGLVQAIDVCSNVLAANFPPGSINRDELPNSIVEL